MPTELSGADVRAVMYRTLMMGALHQLGLSAQKIRLSIRLIVWRPARNSSVRNARLLLFTLKRGLGSPLRGGGTLRRALMLPSGRSLYSDSVDSRREKRFEKRQGDCDGQHQRFMWVLGLLLRRL